MMSYHEGMQDLVKILTNIKNCLDDFDNLKLFQECKELEYCIRKYSISAMIIHRLQKISQLTKSELSGNIEYVKREIEELLRILINFVSWHCKACDKTIDAEHKKQLALWITVHKISNEHKTNMSNFMK